MADYHPLIARAVAGLEKNTGENRRALYERARAALVAQLRGVVPPLDESEITRERLALEEAIRKVEAESVRHAREMPRPPPVRKSAPPRHAEPPPAAAAAPPAAPAAPPVTSAAPSTAAAPASVVRGAAAPGAAASPRPQAPPSPAAKPMPPGPAAKPSAPTSPPIAPLHPKREERPAEQPAGARRSLSDQALKGFRDVVSDPAAAREQARAAQHEERAPAARGLPQAATLPPLDRPPLEEYGAIEPQGQPENLWALPLDERPAPPVDLDASRPPSARPRPPREEPQEWEQTASLERPPRRGRGLIAIALVLLVIAAAGSFAFWQRDAILRSAESIVALLQTPGPPPPREAAPQPSAKITDRLGQPAPKPSGLPVAQRVVLYEEAPDDPQGIRSIGTVVWRTDRKPAAPGRPPELAVRADIEVPERKMAVSWTLRRNTDQSLPASHTIEIVFTLPPDAPSGGVQNVPGVLMKQAEQTRGVPLAGLAVKVTPGYFLVGLSALETDVQRNIALLKERSWFDIPIVYNNNRRAILAMEKGTPGEKAFAQAFAAWTK